MSTVESTSQVQPQRDYIAAARARAAEYSGPRTPPLVFVGGTGRSGTHVVAKLLGRHPYYRNVPIECRFHCDPTGFPDLLADRVTLEDFLRELRGTWWKGFQTSRFRGLHRVVPRERFDAATERFEAAFPAEPAEACRRLFFELLLPLADEVGKPGLIEQSCDTVAAGSALAELFPEAKLIHVVRDGRDAAASRVAQARFLTHPRTWRQGIDWWERRIRRIDQGARHVPENRLLTIGLEELLRHGNVRALRRFLKVRPAKTMRRYHRKRMSAERAHAARWREGLSERRARRVTEYYETVLDRLEADGIYCAPLLREIYRESAEW